MPMTSLRCLELDDRGLIRLAGADARPFLQGLISNDIDLLRPDAALYAALLTPQGKYLFDFLLYDRGDHMLVDVERERLSDLVRRLTLYRLRSQVTIDDASDALTVLAVYDRKPIPTSVLDHSAAVVDPRLPDLGLRIVLRRGELDEFVAEHDLQRVARPAYDRLRISLGVPDGSRDL